VCGLLVDENLADERQAAHVVERLRGDGVEVLADEAIEQRRAARLAEAPLGPIRRAIDAELCVVLDLHRTGFHRHEWTRGPLAAPAAMTRPDMIARLRGEAHCAAQATAGNRVPLLAHCGFAFSSPGST